MDMTPIYSQLVLLNTNIETLIGAIAATGGVQPAAAAPAAEKAETAAKGGRPKTRYFRLTNGTVVKSSSKDAPAGGTEITQDEYDAANLAAAKATKPEPTAGNTASDPFGDDEAQASAEVTLEDVRTAAFKVRDTKGAEAAKAVIEKFAPKLAEVKPEQFAKLKAALEAALSEDL